MCKKTPHVIRGVFVVTVCKVLASPTLPNHNCPTEDPRGSRGGSGTEAAGQVHIGRIYITGRKDGQGGISETDKGIFGAKGKVV